MNIDADYVVVGAGSAGCVLASRLSEDGSTVILLEAGPRDWHPLIHIPAGVGHVLYNNAINWNYYTEPEPFADGRTLHCPRGRVLGGSSSINGMLYVRGNPADYDTWAQLGCSGWSYEDVLPLFKKSERYSGGDPHYRGRDGMLAVEDYQTILPLTHLFVKAAQDVGFPLTSDVNGAVQEGVGYSQMTRVGRLRGSTARTFLKAARNRSNLRIETNAIATSLEMTGSKCVGVNFIQGDRQRSARARREVILSAGTINSPHLLQISGIGPAARLQALGIDVKHDLQGVGSNLSDHYVVRITHHLKNLISINELSRGARLIREALRFATTGRGALTFGVTSAMVFCRSRTELASPDLQLLFTPASYVFGKTLVLESQPGMTVAICPTRAESRGEVMAKSPDPLERPSIRFNYLEQSNDAAVLRAGVAATRRILASSVFAPYDLGETRPGIGVLSECELTDYARREGSSIYHPVGTCKMGTDDRAVVDPRLSVRGLTGLRIADASIMPFTTTGNTNAPTIMIAEKAAQMIREDAIRTT